jgi:alpha-tubulin suppressor-like RCC1 family protein
MTTRTSIIALLILAPGCQLLVPDDGPSSSSDLPSATATHVVAGIQHTCAVTTEGGVRCWGSNDLGQLGAGTEAELDPDDNRDGRFLAEQVVGLETGVAAIGTFGHTTCALTTGGGVKCWGEGFYGALGNGDTEDSAVPVDVVGLDRGVASISVGYGHVCALMTAGGVKCWGDNEDGQLGTGTYDSSDVPVDVIGLTDGVTAVSAGGGQTCVLTIAGGVTCWGKNLYGECGLDDEYTWNVLVPTPVAGLPGPVAKVVAGIHHTCALTPAGGVVCWGTDAEGQLGNDDAIALSAVPVDVLGLTSGVADIHPAGWYTMARVGDAVKLWGAFAITNPEPVPVDTVASSGVTQVAAGNIHACYINTEGGVMCWGNNDGGQVGYWDKSNGVQEFPEPVAVDSLP